jgi:hypothetical protein
MHSKQKRLANRAMIAVAVIGIGVSILDVLAVTPNWAVKFAPLMIGVVMLFLLVQRRQLDIIRVIVRGIRSDRRRGKSTNVEKRAETYREIKWKGLMFRSYSEVKIAKALDYSGVLFISSCKVRLKTEHGRQSREVDFLISHKGRWGILEVDGPYHSADADHWRDTRFREHGVHVYRYDSKRCYEHPKQVVKEFLTQLERSPLAVSDGSKEVFVVEFLESPIAK